MAVRKLKIVTIEAVDRLRAVVIRSVDRLRAVVIRSVDRLRAVVIRSVDRLRAVTRLSKSQSHCHATQFRLLIFFTLCECFKTHLYYVSPDVTFCG